MRGLRLFVRPIEDADHDVLKGFLAVQEPGLVPPMGLVGKLLGEVVALAALELEGEEIRIDRLIVARDLRRKRVGRIMMLEVEKLARAMDRRRIVAGPQCSADEFFRRVGFQEDEGRWVKAV
jgi:N-acetylglutamate synthase-like GNAT family acetyltransferase